MWMHLGFVLGFHPRAFWRFFTALHRADIVERPIDRMRIVAIFSPQFVFEEFRHGLMLHKLARILWKRKSLHIEHRWI